jgi:hypothetical protein
MKFFKSLFASANLFTINSASAKAFTEGWPQIKIFYEILARSFHASEKGNLKDIKSNSGILVQKAEELSIEGMPAEYRNPKILESLLTLKKQTKLVDFLVKQNIDDSEIKIALAKLYDIFHSIVEHCLSKK